MQIPDKDFTFEYVPVLENVFQELETRINDHVAEYYNTVLAKDIGYKSLRKYIADKMPDVQVALTGYHGTAIVVISKHGEGEIRLTFNVAPLFANTL